MWNDPTLLAENQRLTQMVHDLLIQVRAQNDMMVAGTEFHNWQPVQLAANLEGVSESYWQCNKCHAIDERDERPAGVGCRGKVELDLWR